MKEIVKSKIMIGFIVFVLGFTFIDSVNVKRLERTNENVEQEFVVMNEI